VFLFFAEITHSSDYHIPTSGFFRRTSVVTTSPTSVISCARHICGASSLSRSPQEGVVYCYWIYIPHHQRVFLIFIVSISLKFLSEVFWAWFSFTLIFNPLLKDIPPWWLWFFHQRVILILSMIFIALLWFSLFTLKGFLPGLGTYTYTYSYTYTYTYTYTHTYTYTYTYTSDWCHSYYISSSHSLSYQVWLHFC
jgi:hypothetical protein